MPGQVEGPWHHRHVAANGARFHVAEMGDGPLVLLLHGRRSGAAGKSLEPGDATGRVDAGESEQTGEGVR